MLTSRSPCLRLTPTRLLAYLPVSTSYMIVPSIFGAPFGVVI
jgi:hypothetical protein